MKWLAGKRAFEGKSQISVASAILEKEPEPISKIQPMAPAALDHVISECLAKDPESRWQKCRRYRPRDALDREQRFERERGASRSACAIAGGNVLCGLHWRSALLAAVFWLGLRENAPARTLRSYLPAPPDMGFAFTGDFSGPPAITPDGSAIAFCAQNQKERGSIWVQFLGELTAKKLEDTEGASFPFWSPDGKFIGFFAGGHLKKVPAAGGPVTILADAPNPSRRFLEPVTTSSSTNRTTVIHCGRSAPQGALPSR